MPRLVFLLGVLWLTGVIGASPIANPDILLKMEEDATPKVVENAVIEGSEAKLPTEIVQEASPKPEEHSEVLNKPAETGYITECSSEGGDLDTMTDLTDPPLGPLMDDGHGRLTVVNVNITAPVNDATTTTTTEEPVSSEKATDEVVVADVGPAATQSNDDDIEVDEAEKEVKNDEGGVNKEFSRAETTTSEAA